MGGDWIYGVLMLGVLVFVHELGHFVVAKATGVRVLTFSLGFGPRLFGFTRGDTDYRISAVPLGGYVRMYGDDILQDIPASEHHRSFLHKPTLQKSAIAVAGPVANFLLPVGLFFFLYLGSETVSGTVVGTVVPGRPAAEGGLEVGDRIVEIEGEATESFLEVREVIQERPAMATAVVVDRAGKRVSLQITPDAVPSRHPLEKGELHGRIGVMPNIRRPFVRALPGGVAAQAGITDADEILAVNGQEVTSLDDLVAALGRAGDDVELKVKKQPLAQLAEHGTEDGAEIVAIRLERAVAPTPEVPEPPAEDAPTEDLRTEGAPTEGEATPPPAAEAALAAPDEVVPDPAADARFAVTTKELAEPAVRALYDETWRVGAGLLESAQASFGLLPYNASIARVSDETPAARLGVDVGDTVLSVDGLPVHVADEVSSRLFAKPDDVHALALLNAAGELRTLVFRLAPYTQRGLEDFKTFGAVPSGDTYGSGVVITRDVGVSTALSRAIAGTAESVYMTLKSLWMLASGQISLKSLGGPLSIVRIAGQAAEYGIEQFIGTMAFISVNLGIVNLLPIPVLDGGHLLMFGIEAVSRKRISIQTRERAMKVGFAMLLCLLAVAIFNDVLSVL